MAIRATIIFEIIMVFAACSSHLKSGKSYQAMNNFPLAVEYYDAGLRESPGDEEIKDAFIIGEQTYQWRLRQQIDRLVEAKSYLQAIQKLVELKERSLRMKTLTLPGEDPISLENEFEKLKSKAIIQLQEDLDQRGNRSIVMTSDLRACKQLLALGTQDNLISRRCTQILNKLKLVATIVITHDSYPEAYHLSESLARQVMKENPELLEIVNEQSTIKNATITIHLSPPQVHDTGWYVSNQDSYHKWVRKIDKHGRPMTQTITIKPSQEKIDAAKKAGKNPPEAKKVQKKLWVQVRGTYTHHRSVRTVHLPYQLTVTDLRTQTTAVEFDGITSKESSTSYYDFRGHPRARKQVSGREGRHSAGPLHSVAQLAQAARQEVSRALSQKLLKNLD